MSSIYIWLILICLVKPSRKSNPISLKFKQPRTLIKRHFLYFKIGACYQYQRKNTLREIKREIERTKGKST